jgi:hypothetical protein
MQDSLADPTAGLDPEEETEKKLVRYMGLAVLAVVAAGLTALALMPLLKRIQNRASDPLTEPTRP